MFSTLQCRTSPVAVSPDSLFRRLLEVAKTWRTLNPEKVFPASPVYSVHGPRKANAVFVGDYPHLPPRAVLLAHGDDYGGSEFGVFVGLPLRGLRNFATLLDHIGHILSIRAKEKMGRIDASRVIAPMENAKAIRDFSEVVHVAKPMGELLVVEPKPSAAEHAVSLPAVRAGCPIPASVRGCFVNFGPEAIIKHELIMVGSHQKSTGKVYYW